MLTGKYERFQAVLVSNLRAWWSNVTAVLAIPTGVTPAGWRGEAKWKSSLDLWGARSGIPRLSWKWAVLPTDASLHNCLFFLWYSSAECKHSRKSIKHFLTRALDRVKCVIFCGGVFSAVWAALRWLLLGAAADSQPIHSSARVIYTETPPSFVELGQAKEGNFLIKQTSLIWNGKFCSELSAPWSEAGNWRVTSALRVFWDAEASQDLSCRDSYFIFEFPSQSLVLSSQVL